MTAGQSLCLLVVLSLAGLILSFQPLISFRANSITHRHITQRAVLRKTAEVCRDIAASLGQNFNLIIDDRLSANMVQRACSSTGTSASLLSSVMFQFSIAWIYLSNVNVDLVFLLSAKHHFDDETFQEGRDIITADPNTPTCKSCVEGNCNNNLLPDVLQKGLLTTGYFRFSSSPKPAGKCSHGGLFDQSSKGDPVGGINKDDTGSNHGWLHQKAADLAVDATMELLQDIRLAVGDRNFLRFWTFDDHNQCGRLQREHQQAISKWRRRHPRALLVWTSAPPSSEIFVFTDAAAKDAHLKNTITALIESTKSVVTFMLTNALASQRSRRSPLRVTGAITQSDVQLYRDIAQASGGQTIEVTKSTLSQATAVIKDSSASAVVTLFQVVKKEGRKEGRPDAFTFAVDDLLSNVTAYITGASTLTFSLTNPEGVSQSSSQASGPLASFIMTGNLRRLSLNTDSQPGLWQISVSSENSYSVKVIGRSSVNFIYNVVEAHEGAHGDFSLKEGRPLTGGNVSLLVSVTGSDNVKVTEVTLSDSSGPIDVNGSIQSVGSGTFLVTFSGIPAGEFAVCLKGEDSSSTSGSTPSSFQRQAPTQIKTSSISVTARANNPNIEPGSTISIPVTVAKTTNGVVDDFATGTFIVRANNDRSYSSTSPHTVSIAPGSGGKASGTVTLTVPASAPSGTDVTLIIEAENEAATDNNYAVLRFSVAAKWVLIANLTDGIAGTGIERVTIIQGNGTLNTSTVAGAGGENITVAMYSASCCSHNVELAAVDRVGNVGTCVGHATVSSTASTAGHTSNLPYALWISCVVSLLWSCRAVAQVYARSNATLAIKTAKVMQ
ncbi:von Willebrand factor A domain-containing protein 7 Protein G7c Precursor [Channa argus]|uniref:von Willebrand factor A domain-containing protein 7 Protein G7c n=1 Tax=Channa argus TaxID=215402 RepID=A0A6G1PB33_CHAAH|nr:von Willebrand factor A domain-containing protein 7 Protein G7c Precursor [Channa argus]